jgi:hypothetical protein
VKNEKCNNIRRRRRRSHFHSAKQSLVVQFDRPSVRAFEFIIHDGSEIKYSLSFDDRIDKSETDKIPPRQQSFVPADAPSV